MEGLVQPILTIKVNTREAGSVDRIVGEEGNMMKQGGVRMKRRRAFSYTPQEKALI